MLRDWKNQEQCLKIHTEQKNLEVDPIDFQKNSVKFG
jgi:hypothetical protein